MTLAHTHVGILQVYDLTEPMPVWEGEEMLPSWNVFCSCCGAVWARLHILTTDNYGEPCRTYWNHLSARCSECGDGSLLQVYKIASGRWPIGPQAVLREIELELKLAHEKDGL